MEDNNNNNDWNIWARDTINKYFKNQYKAQNSKKDGEFFLNYHCSYFYFILYTLFLSL